MTDLLLRPLPLGRSTFSALRKRDSIYVDKTDLIFNLCKDDSKIFLARPRRFGKSLLISTFESLFKHSLRDFKGLAIEKLWNDEVYTVVTLDFSLVKNYKSAEDFEQKFVAYVVENFRPAGYHGKACFNDWAIWLKTQADSSIVLLIDEYDAPLTECLDRPDLFASIQQQISQFFLTIKSCEGCLRFFFMTGVTKLANTGIFSGFNNLDDISLASDYGTLLGYTEAEIRQYFASHIEQAAKKLQTSSDEIVENLKRHYNGFCFDEEASKRVFCPWSVLNFFKSPARGFLNYWYQSAAHPAILMKYLKDHPLSDPASYAEPKEIQLSRLSASQTYSNLQLEALLFQAGYLSIKDVSGNLVATLGYPNEEVAQSMAQLYADELLGGKAYKEPKGPSLNALLASGSLDEVVSRFNDVFNALDYQRYPVRDEAVCRAFLQVLMMGADMVPNVEVHTACGRSDLEVPAGCRRWVFEVKFARTEAQVQSRLSEGAAQMKARRYGETPSGSSPVELKRAVIVFSSEKRQFCAWANA